MVRHSKNVPTHHLVDDWSNSTWYFFFCVGTSKPSHRISAHSEHWILFLFHVTCTITQWSHYFTWGRETHLTTWRRGEEVEGAFSCSVTSCGKRLLTASLAVNDAAACCWLQPLRDSESRLQSQRGARGDVSADEQDPSSAETMNQALFTCWITAN